MTKVVLEEDKVFLVRVTKKKPDRVFLREKMLVDGKMEMVTVVALPSEFPDFISTLEKGDRVAVTVGSKGRHKHQVASIRWPTKDEVAQFESERAERISQNSVPGPNHPSMQDRDGGFPVPRFVSDWNEMP